MPCIATWSSSACRQRFNLSWRELQLFCQTGSIRDRLMQSLIGCLEMHPVAAAPDVDVINERLELRLELGEAMLVEADGLPPVRHRLACTVASENGNGLRRLPCPLVGQHSAVRGEPGLAPLLHALDEVALRGRASLGGVRGRGAHVLAAA